MDALTVKDLYENMKDLLEKGKGDFVVFVTDDEEGNGYHALWYAGVEISNYKGIDRKYMESSNADINLVRKDKDKAVYMG